MATFLQQPENDLITTDSVPSAPRTDAVLNKQSQNASETNQQFEKSTQQGPEQIQTENAADPSFKTRPNRKPTNMKTKPSKTKNYGGCAPIIISNSSGVHIGPNININCSKPSNKESEVINQYTVKTKDVEILLESTVAINDEHLQFISKHIGEGWRKVARALKYSDGQIHQVYADFKIDGLGEVIYQLLLGWYRNDPDKAKLGLLADVLWQSDEFEVVHKMTKYLN